MSAPIFLASGNRMKRVIWKAPGGTWGDLAALHKKGTRINPRFARGSRELARSPFTDVRFPGRFSRAENLRIRMSRRSRRATARAGGPRRAVGPGVVFSPRAPRVFPNASLTLPFPRPPPT